MAKHIHRYHKIYPQMSGNVGKGALGKMRGVWACALPDCTHYMPLNVADQVVGKKSLCWGCGDVFILDEDNMKKDQPVCLSCSGVDLDALEALLKEKGL